MMRMGHQPQQNFFTESPRLTINRITLTSLKSRMGNHQASTSPLIHRTSATSEMLSFD